MKRVKPCQNCKRRRRKCERKENKTECERCIRLKLTCSFDTAHYDPTLYNDNYMYTEEIIGTNIPEIDGNSTLTELYQHVQDMEREMEILQIELDKQRKEQQIIQATKKRRILTNNNNNNNNNNDILSIPSEWKLTIANGHLRIETGINTLGELLNLGYKYKIRSLSPFDNQPPLRFQITGQESFIYKISTLLNITELFNSSKNDNNSNHEKLSPSASTSTSSSSSSSLTSSSLPSSYLIPNDHSSASITISWDSNQNDILSNFISSPTSSTSQLSSPSLSTSSSMTLSPLSASIIGEFHHSSWNEYASVINILITNYFHCQNMAIPLLHKPTFMKRYQEYDLVNQQFYQDHYFSGTTSSIVAYLIKSYSPITLAVSCFMCVSFCHHIPLTVRQKRDYAELFYLACKDQIYDMLDDPDRQIEALICINFIFKFMVLTLRLKEGRRLISIGYLMTCEFRQLTPSDYSELDCVLMQRHGFLTNALYVMTEFVSKRKTLDEKFDPKSCPLMVLPDENEDTLKVLKLYQNLIELALHPISRKMIGQLRYIIFGEVGNLSLQDIMDYDKVCLDWWKMLPQEWKLCDNPFDLSSAKYIEQCNDIYTLLAYTFLLTMTVGVYTCLCHPLSLDDQITLAIQHRATTMILNCCELLMCSADRMKKINSLCGYACEYIFRVLDSLVVLGEQIKNQKNKNADADLVLDKIKECIRRFDFIVFEGHEVPIGASIFSKDDAMDLSSDDILSIYKKYPFPGYAIMYDLMNSSASSLGVTISNPL